MIQLILILLGFTSGDSGLNRSSGIQSLPTIQTFNYSTTDSGTGIDNDSDTSGNTGQKPPFSQP